MSFRCAATAALATEQNCELIRARRGFVRCATELLCEVITRHHDDVLLSWATDLSESGLFVESSAPSPPGEDLVVSFRPIVHWTLPELTVFARVARTTHGRRRGDVDRGMGLRFLDLSHHERCALTRWLMPRAPLAPRSRASKPPTPPRVPPAHCWSEHPFASRVG